MDDERWWEAIDRKGSEPGHMRLGRLARWMHDNNYDFEAILAMLESPWNWTKEFQCMTKS